MAMPLEVLEAETLKLDTAARARLAERMIASLNEGNEIYEAWAIEVQRRTEAIDAGGVQLIPSADAIAQARAAPK